MKIIALFLALATVPFQAFGQKPPYLDPSLPVTFRVDDLISRMTLQEKVDALQNNAPGIPRLGIQPYGSGHEGLHGVVGPGYTTLFPQAIGMAATFDAPLLHQMGNVVGMEAHALFNMTGPKGISHFNGLNFWSPNINIFRDPRWGRGQETYGEDPFLTSRLGVAYITGLQGDDPRYLLAAAGPKHLAAHSGPEADRHRWDTIVSPHDLQDTYLVAFHAAISEAHAASTMCAYNRINGVPACANSWLLTDTVKKSWGLNGYVVSDCGAIGDLSDGQHYVANFEEASASAIKAGMDLSCDWVPDGARPEFSYLLEAYQHKLIAESDLDRALRNVFAVRMRLGLFDPPEMVPYSKLGSETIHSRDHRQLALTASREAIVLLKNSDDFLPLKNPKSIAVVGPNADVLQVIEGNYNAVPLSPVTPLAGIRQRFKGALIHYAQGAPLVENLPIVVDETVLHPASGSAQAGLKGEYFANPDFAGSPTTTRIDRTINFDWSRAEPALGIPTEDYSVRWTGTLTPPAQGDYAIGVKTKGCTTCSERERFKLYLDGQLIQAPGAVTGNATTINFNAGAAGSGTTVGVDSSGPLRVIPLHFTDTRPHDIRIEYVHRNVPTHHFIAGGLDLIWQAPLSVQRDQAVAAAKSSDVIVACVGLSPEIEGEELPVKLPGFLAGDRTDILLPAAQVSLLEALNATGKPLVVVLMTGSAVSVPFATANAKAILEAWYPGEAGGTAIAETLAGDNNPAGRLPITFYTGVDQLPAFGDYGMANRTYRYFAGRPAYGFGFGLSYSTFRYSDLRVSTQELVSGGMINATFRLKNTSRVDGDEVAEFYLTPPLSPISPIRRLIGFQRVHLRAGEEQTVTMPLTSEAASSVNDDGSRTLVPGSYTLFIAGAQPAEAKSSVTLKVQVR